MADAKSLTPSEAARKLGVHPGTLANWRSWGIGPRFVKCKEGVFYPEKDLERYAKERQS